jgi:hypothetical protein
MLGSLTNSQAFNRIRGLLASIKMAPPIATLPLTNEEPVLTKENATDFQEGTVKKIGEDTKSAHNALKITFDGNYAF